MRIDGRSLVVAACLALLPAGNALAQEAGRLTGLKLDGDKPIQIESDHLEVRENDGVAIFTGNVSVVQGPTLLRSGKMTVHYNTEGGSATTGSADIDRLEVEGKVYVKSETQVATGDSGSFDMRSEVLVLSGKEVVLTEGDNVVVGCRLTVQMSTGLATLDGCGKQQGGSGGRVKMLLKPGSQNR
ncbi:MAG: LptA/OstA family protein [Neoaquamicrobium sediminum]|jgi:lipopolysaccharide export system protein LptA|uniref:LptA/OstA family protein n=1 Tax=Neoaquamicrobium sediminum TaxID=1849104 RepID=A0ABV3WPM1_9HYPH|nr:LptA/OstA family protein [Mesorhizobium sp.]